MKHTHFPLKPIQTDVDRNSISDREQKFPKKNSKKLLTTIFSCAIIKPQ